MRKVKKDISSPRRNPQSIGSKENEQCEDLLKFINECPSKKKVCGKEKEQQDA